MQKNLKYFLIAVACTGFAVPVKADTKTCTYEKIIMRSYPGQNDANTVGVGSMPTKFRIEAAENTIWMEWIDGGYSRIPIGKIMKNNRFTTYITYEDVEVTDVFRSTQGPKTREHTFSHRMYADGERAEIHVRVTGFEPEAYRYICK